MLQLKESGKASEKISKTEIRTQPDKEFKKLATKTFLDVSSKRSCRSS